MELPNLELPPSGEAPKYNLQVAEAEASKPENPQFALSSLTEDEQKYVKDFMQKIDISSTNVVMQYGAGSQTKIAKFSDSVLQNVRSRDLGEVGADLTNLVVELKNFDNGEERGGLRGLFSGVKRRADRMMANFSKAETNIDSITKSLENHQRTLMKDTHMLEEMFKNNTDYLRELTFYIIAGYERLEEYRANDIPRQRQIAEETNNEIEAQKLSDMMNLAERFEKKLHDLKLTRMITIQMAPQIRMVQNNNVSLIEQIQSSIVNSIPLWKNQMVIALGLQNSKKAMDAQNRVTDMTNQLLIKNSEMLKQGSIEVAEASQRGIVEIETIQRVNDNLIETITSVLDIQQKGAENRRNAGQELEKIEEDLKKALIDATAKYTA